MLFFCLFFGVFFGGGVLLFVFLIRLLLLFYKTPVEHYRFAHVPCPNVLVYKGDPLVPS